MLIPTIIICIQGVCFNPAIVAHLESGKNNSCEMVISRNRNSSVHRYKTFINTTCEALAAQINQKIKEQLK